MVQCKWLSDSFNQVCVNADCPVCADFCPLIDYYEICKYFEQNKETESDINEQANHHW